MDNTTKLLTSDDNASSDSFVDLSGYVLSNDTILIKKRDIDHLMSSDDGFIKSNNNEQEDTHSKLFGQNIKRVIDSFRK